LAEEIDLLLVTGSDCKACERVKQRLGALQSEFPGLRIREVDIGSPEGTQIAVRYRLVGLPGILIKGRMVLAGDVSEDLLRQRLALAASRQTAEA
jgi:hypothetical protein